MRLKYLFVLLAAVLFAWPQVGYCQDEEDDYTDPNQPIIDSLQNLITPDSPDSLKARLYYEMGFWAINPDSILVYARHSLKFCSEDVRFEVKNNFLLYYAYAAVGEYDSCLIILKKNVELCNKAGLLGDLSDSYQRIASVFDNKNNPDSTFGYINKAMDISVRAKDTINIAYCYYMLGMLANNRDLDENAERNTRQAAHLYSLINDAKGMSKCNELLGIVYRGLFLKNEDVSKLYLSLDYLKNAVYYYDTIKYVSDTYQKYAIYDNLAYVYILLANATGDKAYADSCIVYQKPASEFYLQSGIITDYLNSSNTLLEYFLFLKKYKEAEDYLLSLGKYIDDNLPVVFKRQYYMYLEEFYETVGDWEKAFKNQKIVNVYAQEYLNDSTLNAMADMKTEQAMMIEKLDREKAEAIHAAEKQKMHIVIISLIGGLLLISLLVFFIFRALEIKKKANAELLEKNAILIEQKEEIQTQRDEIEDQKEEIEAQRDEIMAQRDHIEEQRDRIEAQNKEIQASISYAQRIQRSLLTPSETINSIFPDHFLLYKPRNIVSGDYYWVGQFGDNKVCIVADCTGHGVPGGFMSVLGMSNLNHIVGQDVTPDMILNRLREEIIVNLRQSADAPTALQDSNDAELLTDNTDRSRDGMDVAAYVVNERLMKLSYAGANNPLVLIRNNEVQVLKADKMPVGIYARLDPFQCTTIDIQRGDCLYTFSDGFQDQFGYESGKKFLSKRLRELLLEIHQQPMAEQKAMLNTVYEEWRGPVENQTDDVVVMGVRI